jgi:hypothetical protein
MAVMGKVPHNTLSPGQHRKEKALEIYGTAEPWGFFSRRGAEARRMKTKCSARSHFHPLFGALCKNAKAQRLNVEYRTFSLRLGVFA